MATPRSGLSLPCARHPLRHGRIAFAPGAVCLAPSLPARLKLATIPDCNVDFVGEKDKAAGVLKPAHGARHRGCEAAAVGMNLCRRRPGQISIATPVIRLCGPRRGSPTRRKRGVAGRQQGALTLGGIMSSSTELHSDRKASASADAFATDEHQQRQSSLKRFWQTASQYWSRGSPAWMLSGTLMLII